MPHYIDAPTYQRLVDALLTLPADPVSGSVEADQIKVTLGEIADLWPETIRDYGAE